MVGTLDLRRLRYFQATAIHGSLSAAARALNVSQPALTHHMAELERLLGMQVLERRPRGVVVTKAGEVLLHHAGLVLDAVALAEAELRLIHGPRDHHVVSVAVVQSVADMLTPGLLAAIEREIPGVTLRILDARWRRSHEMVDNGEVDFAVTWANETRLQGTPLVWQSLVLASAPSAGHHNEPISVSDLAGERLILPTPGSELRRLIDRIAGQAGVRLHVTAEVEGGGARKQAVIAGLGSTVLPWVNFSRECSAGLLVARPIVNPPIGRLIVLEHREGLDPNLVDGVRRLLRRLLESASEEERRSIGPALASA